MKTALALLLAGAIAGCATPGSQTPDPLTSALLDKVVVERMDLDLGAPQVHDGKHLWDAFANKPYERQFSTLSTKDWFTSCKQFQGRILSLAEAGGLDVDSLRKAFDGLSFERSNGTARVPVGAFAARKGADDVWIIVLKWEIAGSYEENGETHWHNLGHIEVIAVRVKDGKRVDSTRCG